MDKTEQRELASLLYYADRWKFLIPPLSARGVDLSEKEAYEVQDKLTALYGSAADAFAGYKIGGISYGTAPGAFGPHCGILLREKILLSGAKLQSEDMLEPGLEAEVALRLCGDITPEDLSPAAVRAAIGGLMPAWEIVESRQVRKGKTLSDSLADNASYGGCVLGGEYPAAALEGREIRVEVLKNETILPGERGSVNLDILTESLIWLAGLLAGQGKRLKRGDLILAGALTKPLIPATPGDILTARFTDLGEVTLQVNPFK